MARSAGEEGLNHQVVSFKSPADTPKCPECCGNHGFCAAVPVVRIHLPPAESQQRWLIVSSAIAQESSTAIAIRSRSADRGGRVAPPAADPSQATGRVKGRINQLHRARVLEVRIQSPPAESQQTFGSSNDGGPLFDRMILLPSSGPWDEKDLIGNPPLPTFVEAVGPAGRGLACCRRYDLEQPLPGLSIRPSRYGGHVFFCPIDLRFYLLLNS